MWDYTLFCVDWLIGYLSPVYIEKPEDNRGGTAEEKPNCDPRRKEGIKKKEPSLPTGKEEGQRQVCFSSSPYCFESKIT